VGPDVTAVTGYPCLARVHDDERIDVTIAVIVEWLEVDCRIRRDSSVVSHLR
jgi:hypothetical protein